MKPVRKAQRLIWFLTGLAFVLAACSAGQTLNNPGATPTAASAPSEVGQEPSAAQAASDEPGAGDPYCTDADNPHPIGQNIASTYTVPYEQVMAWYCSGNIFDDILIALETSPAVEIPVEALLEMRQQEKSWETIWNEIGFVEQP